MKIINKKWKTIEEYKSIDEFFSEIEEEHNLWYNKYFLNHILRIYYRIEGFPKKFKWFIQRRKRGFDDLEVWNLKSYLKIFLAKRIEVWLKRGVNSYVDGISYTKWVNILKEILWWARDSVKEEHKLWERKKSKEISEKEYNKQLKKWYKRVERATGYLGEYAEDLWD